MNRPSTSALSAPKQRAVYQSRDDIALTLKRQIQEGNFPKGSRLPPIRSLATILKASTRTVNLALKDLARAGIVELKPRKGARVCTGKDSKNVMDGIKMEPVARKFERITRELANRIARGDIRTGEPIPQHKFLKFQFATSYATLRRALKLAESNRLIHRKGSRYFAGPPRLAASRRKSLATPLLGWSVPQNQSFLDTTDGGPFFLDFERELSRNHISYVGRFGPDESAQDLPGIRDFGKVEGHYYPCTQGTAWQIAEGKQPLMERELRRINRKGIPVVLFNCGSIQGFFPNLSFRPFGNVFAFGINNHAAGECAGEYLANLGHRRVAYFSFGKEPWNIQRYEGTNHGMAQASKESATTIHFPADYSWDSVFPYRERANSKQENISRRFVRDSFKGHEFVRKNLLGQVTNEAFKRVVIDLHHSVLKPFFEQALTDSGISAWVGADSTVGLAAANFLATNSVRVPGQISLMAIHDDRVLSERAITGCDLQTDRMGYLAAHCLLDDIPIRRDKRGVVECPPRIIERGSVGRVQNQ